MDADEHVTDSAAADGEADGEVDAVGAPDAAVKEQYGIDAAQRARFSDTAIVGRLGHEMAAAFDVGATANSDIADVSDVVEQVLLQLDEFELLLETIRTVHVGGAKEALPMLTAQARELETLFKQIDHLEGAVAFVRKSVDTAQQRIEETEQAYNKNPLTKVLSSIRVPFMKRKARPGTIIPQMPEWRPMDVFAADELLMMHKE